MQQFNVVSQMAHAQRRAVERIAGQQHRYLQFLGNILVQAEQLGAAGIAEALKAPAETDEEKTAKIARVKALYDSVNVADAAKGTIADLSGRAILKAAEADLPEEGLDALKRFAHSRVGRSF